MDNTPPDTYIPPTPFQPGDIVYRIIKELPAEVIANKLHVLIKLGKLDLQTAWGIQFTNPTESYVYNKSNNRYYLISNVLLGYVLPSTHPLGQEEGGRGHKKI